MKKKRMNGMRENKLCFTNRGGFGILGVDSGSFNWEKGISEFCWLSEPEERNNKEWLMPKK